MSAYRIVFVDESAYHSPAPMATALMRIFPSDLSCELITITTLERDFEIVRRGNKPLRRGKGERKRNKAERWR